MNKSKKYLVLALAGILTLSLSGCFKNQVLDGDGMVNSEPVPVASEVSSDSGWEKPSASSEVAPVEQSIELPTVQSGEAVYYNGKVLFRNYSSNALESAALFGEFGRTGYCYQPSSLCTFDPADPSKGPEFVTEDNGFGDMYLVNQETLYSQLRLEGNSEESPVYAVYKKNLKTGEGDQIGSGKISAFSPDGKHYASEGDSYNPYLNHIWIYDAENDDKEVAHLVYDTYAYLLGMDNEHAYIIKTSIQNEGTQYEVNQVSYDGTETYLATLDFSTVTELTFPNYNKDITINDDSISFRMDYYEGTGHFYSGSVEATVPISNDAKDAEIRFFTEEDDPEAVLPSSISEIANQYPDFESARGFARVLQYYTSLADGTFFVQAECIREPMGDIGWRENYMFSNLDYYFLPADSKEPVLIHRMYEPLGKRGSLEKYEYYETQPNMVCMTGFFKDENGKLVGIYYEPVLIEGPESPIEESNSFFIADLAKEFYYEHPHNDEIYEEFDVEGLDEFEKEIYSWEPKNNMPVKDAEYDYEGNLVIGSDDYSFEGHGTYIAHITFDENGNVNYIRPVIFD